MTRETNESTPHPGPGPRLGVFPSLVQVTPRSKNPSPSLISSLLQIIYLLTYFPTISNDSFIITSMIMTIIIIATTIQPPIPAGT